MAFASLFTPIRVGFLSLAVVVAGLAPASAQTTGAQTPPAPAGATPPPLPAPETVVARVGDQDILMLYWSVLGNGRHDFLPRRIGGGGSSATVSSPSPSSSSSTCSWAVWAIDFLCSCH